MNKLKIDQLETSGEEVLVRVDFNVPLNDAGQITDDTRIQAALPTIEKLVSDGAKVILCSHLGRPKGEVKKEFSLKPAAARLGELLGATVKFASDCIGVEVAALRSSLENGEVLLLENVRFHAGETANDPDFARELAGSADYFVNDAFGTAHRAHASTEGVTHHVAQSAMGYLIERELDYLQGALENPERPFLVIMGGAKVSGKIDVITSLMEKADAFIIGGAMAYTFFAAEGYDIGDSMVEMDRLELARDILQLAESKGVEILLPDDSIVTQEFSKDAETKATRRFSDGGGIQAGWQGIDIGPEAVKDFSAKIQQAKTIVWNGPMGVFEIDAFANGTRAIAEAVAASDAVSIVGGGDSVTAAKKFGVEGRLSFLSTGGGASLELLEGKLLPGVDALSEA